MKIKDETGQQAPTRHYLKPNYGVVYMEPADPQKSLGPVKMSGPNVYLSPKFENRMRKQDLAKK